MGQVGAGKKIVVVVLCLVIAGGYFVGHHAGHSSVVQKSTNSTTSTTQAQVVKIDASKRLRGQLTRAWQAAVAAKAPDGNFDIAVYDKTSDTTALYGNTKTGYTFNTASTVKLSILETLLYQNQKNGITQLTANQLSYARPMIEQSDNDAASALWAQVGAQTGVNSYYQLLGMSNSTANVDWGLTQTTPFDQLKILKAVAYPGDPLTAASASQADDLMDKVESDQHWGVSGGVPAGVTVQLKNGWLAYDQYGWIVNSIGHVHGDGVDYVIAVYTDGNNTMQDGINTIEALSSATWQTVQAAGKPQG